eukprot:CAMPEP_0201567166 /NCGR_PEP_ID=MMETSP0190_2-20130828/7517_1 /ASSEMBLY_ACC=CAM_ASM_000263 /TAXON_ID=37353 /ORGANISM="Rosalina sp." /LENGTH=621 /DNA_ID=CAMNT_0047986831 /DNA_START=49 /DNA_END=1914 /DNA_ORIENTATION=-
MFMNQLVCIIGLLINRITSFSTDWSTEFDYYTYLDEDELFRLYWTDLENDIIEFGMEASATGWIALGVSPNGQMPNSDIAIGWVDDDATAYLQDRYTTGRTTPLYDPSQNLTLIEGEQADGMTRIRFQRPKYTCNENDIQLSQGTTRMIWAFHETMDPSTEMFDSSSISAHTNKGAQSLNLDSGVSQPVELEDDIEYLDITMDAVSLPSTDTTYYCKLFEIPSWLNDTRHVVKFGPIVQEGNEGAVHHLLAYSCDEELVRVGDVGTEGVCDEAFENMPSEECVGGVTLYAWAIGGEELYMPEGVGFPIGGDNGPKYIMMEMHYDNPEEKSDIVDSSGFRMYVTQQLRDTEAGVMSIGSWTSPLGHYIPPGLSYAHNQAFMYGECTKDVFPETGINVFANVLHQHTIGTASTLRRIRDGKEIEPVDSNWAYDFNYQNSIIFDPPRVILPGDTLILDCYYDSTSRDFFTYGGESTSEEMCFSFYFYYPAVDFQGSGSAKTEAALSQWMKDANSEGYLTGDIDYALENSDFSNIGWDNTKDGHLEFYNRLWSTDYEEYNQNYMGCGGEENGVWLEEVSLPTGFEEYDANVFTCDETTSPPEDKAYFIGNICFSIIMGFLGFMFV